MYEWEFPFQYIQMEYATDTAAPGQWRGAPAIHYRRLHTHALHTVSYVQGWRHPAQGCCGGRPGAGNRYVLDEGMASELEVLEACYHVPVPAGSVVFSQSGAGGGWGDPFKRDPRAVLDDVLDEYVSVEGARRDYGVVIHPDTFELDMEATRKARAR
jgi:N-methylhydantoinase B